MKRPAKKPAPEPVEFVSFRPAVDPLRDEIALRVMSTLLSHDVRGFFEQITLGNGPASFRNVATISYAMADAMMRERG